MAVDAPEPENVLEGSWYTDPEKVDFEAFIVQVINCTAQTNKKSKKLDIIVSAAERFLGLQELTAEALQGILSEDVSPCQPPETVSGPD